MQPETDIRPCRYMKNWVHALSHDNLRGPARWWAKLHVGYCNQCRHALTALQSLNQSLRELKNSTGALPTTLGSDRLIALENAFDEVEQVRS